MLRAEQKRLDTELAATNRSLSNLTADLAEADELISIALDIAQHAGNTYRQAPEHIRRMFNQLLFDKLLVTTDDNGQHHADATSRAPFDVIYSPNTRALVHEARHAQPNAIPDITGQTKEPAEAGGLSLDVLPDQFIALVEGSSKSIVVDLGGLEPPTPCMPCRCATSCATDPWCAPRSNLNSIQDARLRSHIAARAVGIEDRRGPSKGSLAWRIVVPNAIV